VVVDIHAQRSIDGSVTYYEAELVPRFRYEERQLLTRQLRNQSLREAEGGRPNDMSNEDRIRLLKIHWASLDSKDKILAKSTAQAIGTPVVAGLKQEFERINTDFPGLLAEFSTADFTIDALRLQIGPALARLKAAIEEGQNRQFASSGKKIFIGHGRSPAWLQLKVFLSGRLHLECDEFNEESAAGIATVARLNQMLDAAQFALLVMTAEDKHADETAHARENVIHEAGLFQGRLGFERAIILREDGCAEFSNIHGLTSINFPKGNLEAAFEKVRHVLEREHIIDKVWSR